ncbi:hypothetical protein AJ79_06680 [Helicocarpus griseus UAMH5409]|uniref:Uncharacterized protein n=1 Tax=Helicocarpus griseus UAMH5409 TaxID=1447875 RepID=A0A2B7XAC0_9EURO|nr:hypothetical protein AJ79_06680 [Helicocarpus griseus UAMH5409]
MNNQNSGKDVAIRTQGGHVKAAGWINTQYKKRASDVEGRHSFDSPPEHLANDKNASAQQKRHLPRCAPRGLRISVHDENARSGKLGWAEYWRGVLGMPKVRPRWNALRARATSLQIKTLHRGCDLQDHLGKR